MKETALGSIIFTALLLALPPMMAESILLGLLIIAAGMLWAAGAWYNWTWANGLGLVAFVGFAGFGIWRSLPTIWMLLGTVAALVSWDLVQFSQRLESAGPLEDGHSLHRTHLRRLLLVSGLGLLLGGVTWSIQIRLNFGWIIFLGLLMTISLSWVVRVVRRIGG